MGNLANLVNNLESDNPKRQKLLSTRTSELKILGARQDSCPNLKKWLCRLPLAASAWPGQLEYFAKRSE